MKTERIKGKVSARESVVVCRKDVFRAELAPRRDRLSGGGGILFTDSNVYALYRKKIEMNLAGVPVFVMPAGEEHKNEQTLFSLLRTMAEHGLRRNSTLVALGGGVVGDIGGLAASLYMRGIACIQVPTTLLAQVDSSVGGKTAVDFCGVKNLVGAFYPPEFVFADPSFLKTLPPREIRCGLGEIIKHAALNAELFDLLSQNREKLFDLNFLGEIVPKNIAIKADVVRRDPTEKGLRRCLNLGHTTGHAAELSGADLSHGECVLVGLLYESRIARKYSDVDGEYLSALEELIRFVLAGADWKGIDVGHAARLALLDKKNTKQGEITLTVPVKKGEYAMLELPFAAYERALSEIGESL